MTPMVEIDTVTRRFGDTAAVREASVRLERGEFLTILGPSGCGKTTLLRMIAGFDRPSSGRILINGEAIDAVPPFRRSIGMVFQRLALFPHMTAAENVAYPLKMRRFDLAEIPERVERYLELVRLKGFGSRRPHEMSGGQQQRVAIARALSFSPDLLLLDEPLSALDRKLREEMQLEFRRIQQELGVTTINVTHDQREALVMSDRVVVMDAGRIQQADTPAAVYRQPSNSFVARFIGMTTLFPGVVAEAPEGIDEIIVGDVRLPARFPATSLAPGTAVDCGLRAEQVRILPPGAPRPETTLGGIVERRIFEGDRLVYEVRVPPLGNLTLMVFDHDPATHAEHEIGARVLLGWNARDLFVFPTETTENTSRQETGPAS
ncbi:ABC transporter ATP-binding protein (plasmid) [Paroceanicella profunda]|uniref:Spermidine/putrescine import ATP-binding protein PotA n=1 Tax=Paroceanicella profunda TaxID=2579971 RepID=A0A5B8FZH3_9RHOB|nr:ABC transporter ATP-binding protein [Paroceanicella profunda]QDL93875.1 ABC transporter ATP-binding protein [Paroceanicella profunda]